MASQDSLADPIIQCGTACTRRPTMTSGTHLMPRLLQLHFGQERLAGLPACLMPSSVTAVLTLPASLISGTFSGVTKSGRVWRKVPESDARRVGTTVTVEAT